MKKGKQTAKQIILQAKNTSVKFGAFFAVKDFSFMVREGELHFLIGPNGAGKTTFLDLVCGKTRESEGSLILKEKHDLSKLKEFEIVRKGVGRKFQAPSVFGNLTVWENLELSMKQDKRLSHILRAKPNQEKDAEIKEMLALIGLSEQKDEQARLLSHGQKQWLEMGMVMMQKPSLLMLDEPIAGMTEEEEEKTGELLLKMKEKCAIIVVEHDMEFVRKYSEKVTVMHEGQLLCEGTMDDIQGNERVMEVYLGRKGDTADASTPAARSVV
ncbi:urea ABC transporter ATP-binding protein UrtD [Gracilibacillus alcaliphilus]|uniref:urea ABC transporter ATP-binding protein UrtD n=1 Tax=Gracilibacillus alcaliphilus TaxID=1401441 RepID=UPI00195D0D38|nr:urea ABC transporter ATP-binding protein UrtD [Gracilibacillus alcaliphilus]MBM7677492.1 urea transport system ATP-binding protein [Gracilibacillus alcaliphilus]